MFNSARGDRVDSIACAGMLCRSRGTGWLGNSSNLLYSIAGATTQYWDWRGLDFDPCTSKFKVTREM